MGHLFLIKPVEFEHAKEDPFGFDTYSGKVAQKYIPFSGSIRKPLYLLFVRYVNWLIDQGFISAPIKNEEIRLRLEKLFVRSLIQSNTSHRFIIGSTFRAINPFKGNDGNWVIQNCYKIYDESARILISSESGIVEDYHKKHIEQVKLLNDFLKRTGTLEANKRYLESLLRQLKRKKTSLFSGNLLLSKGFRKSMFHELKSIIKKQDHGFGNDKAIMAKLFDHPSRATGILHKLLQNEKYPFRHLNVWFSCFIRAVDADINGSESGKLWSNADKFYDIVPDKNGTDRRPQEGGNKFTKVKCWFAKAGDKYIVSDNFNESGWEALVRRANRDDHEVYSFRTDAFGNLLKELDPHAD